MLFVNNTATTNIYTLSYTLSLHDASHGCIRMSNAGITKLAQVLPLGVPVTVEAGAQPAGTPAISGMSTPSRAIRGANP